MAKNYRIDLCRVENRNNNPIIKMNQKEQKKELDEKLAEVKKLNDVIQLSTGKVLTKELKQEIENWAIKLEFRLNELVMESKLKESDIKIEVYKNVVELLKKDV